MPEIRTGNKNSFRELSIDDKFKSLTAASTRFRFGARACFQETLLGMGERYRKVDCGHPDFHVLHQYSAKEIKRNHDVRYLERNNQHSSDSVGPGCWHHSSELRCANGLRLDSHRVPQEKTSLAKGYHGGCRIGYAFSNVFGWMIGGSTVRYRLYTRWGFSLIEVLAFISVIRHILARDVFVSGYRIRVLAGASSRTVCRTPSAYREALWLLVPVRRLSLFGCCDVHS